MIKLFYILTAIFFMYLFIFFPLDILLLGFHKQLQILSRCSSFHSTIVFLVIKKCVIFNINSITSMMKFFLGKSRWGIIGHFLSHYLMALIPSLCVIFEYNDSTSNDARSVFSGTAEGK